MNEPFLSATGNERTISVKNRISQVTYDEVGNIIKEKFSGSKSKYKSFETFINGKLNVVKGIKEKNLEIGTMAEDIIKDILDCYKRTFKAKELVIERIGFIRDGHTFDYYKGFDNDYRVWLYEDKSPTIIDKEKINFILKLILQLKVGEHYNAKYFFDRIIEHYKLTINNDEFSGGKNRSLFYFPIYLCPIKIIEKELKIIKVTIGRGGGIIRLK